ncbi:four-helix bundle copper-binding protein [Hamadaea tsunoensis]|uniref:four-helix bundle copper-binding protein n=1 Tax=Hamadaea tsunoensis TaxID=53368 RepID=UPI0004273C18|nr:four-helix bundle copper-binding protein [Hamadaea tsunoensis]
MPTLSSALSTHPARRSADHSVVTETIALLDECAQICTTCADACLYEEETDRLATCIRLDLDCADICATAVRMLCRAPAKDLSYVAAMLDLVRLACRRSAEECAQHADKYEHCKVCAEAAIACERACGAFIESMRIPAAA